MSEHLVWVDLEMTGLDIDKDHILEMACLITDGQLNMLAKGPNLIIHQSDSVLSNMNEWSRVHHQRSGLTEACKKSKVSLQAAEMEMLSFVRQHTPPGKCALAGSSVHADRVFLMKHMPQFLHHLHYRIVDVSSFKEICRRWYPEDYLHAPVKKLCHRALDDIRESITELQYYRNAIFKQ